MVPSPVYCRNIFAISPIPLGVRLFLLVCLNEWIWPMWTVLSVFFFTVESVPFDVYTFWYIIDGISRRKLLFWVTTESFPSFIRSQPKPKWLYARHGPERKRQSIEKMLPCDLLYRNGEHLRRHTNGVCGCVLGHVIKPEHYDDIISWKQNLEKAIVV